MDRTRRRVIDASAMLPSCCRSMAALLCRLRDRIRGGDAMPPLLTSNPLRTGAVNRYHAASARGAVMPRSIHFGVFLHGTGNHTAGWRYPGADQTFLDI